MPQSVTGPATETVRRDMHLGDEIKAIVAEASQHLTIDARMLAILSQPQRTVKAVLPLRRDDGTLELCQAYRCQYNNALGPYKGGLRYHPAVNEDLVVGLAGMMTWKNALVGLPFGGAKGGVAVDPRQLSLRELESITRTMTRAFRRFIHPERDVPAPDVGTDARVMTWIRDEYESTRGVVAPAIVTGKPIEHGGLAEREPATGRGVITAAQAAAAHEGLPFNGATVSIQGFGKVGRHAARTAVERGAKVVALSDVSGALHDPNGLPIDRIERFAADNGGLIDGFDGRAMREPDSVLSTPCDILVPAALENQLHSGNVHDVQAKIVVEAANGPTTPPADKILHERGIPVLPDILANAGGVILSYFEWQQGVHPETPKQTHTLEWMDNRIAAAAKQVMERSATANITLRSASYGLAIERVATRMMSKYPWLAA